MTKQDQGRGASSWDIIKPGEDASTHEGMTLEDLAVEAVKAVGKSIEEVEAKEATYEALAGLPFRVRLGQATAFDHTTDPGTVILGAFQLASMGITQPSEIDFCMIHELGHFKELVEDPDGFKKVISEADRSDGLGQAYFRFYNSLMDIYVNRNTMNKAPEYRDGKEYSQEVKDLYTKKLFAQRDFTELPLSTQYSYALLNIGMGVGDDLIVSPEVRQALDEPFMRGGKPRTTEELIETRMIPAIGIRSTKEWRATLSERKRIIDDTFRKRFEKLVTMDKERGDDPTRGSPGGDGQGIEAPIEDFKKAIQQAKKIVEEKAKSAEEKAADDREKKVGDQARKHLTPEDASDLAKMHRKVFPQIVEVVNIFKQIVEKEVTLRRETKGFFKTGTDLDMPEVVEEMPTILSNPTQARVFTREIPDPVVVEKQKHIRLWSAFDLSGSMSGDINLVKELCVLFSGSIQTLSLGAELGQHEVTGSYGAVGYANDAFELLPCTDAPTYEDIAKIYGKLIADGGTYEAPALRNILNKIKAAKVDDKVVDIVVVVTDGETSGEEESKAAIKELKALGVKVLAFQFSRGYLVPDKQPDKTQESEDALREMFQRPEPESGTFGKIWGRDGYKVRGARQVVPAVREALRGLLQDV